MQILYNADGEIVDWAIVLDENYVTMDFIHENCSDVTLLKTKDGRLISERVRTLLIMARR